MKRVDLFGSSGEEDVNDAKLSEIMMVVEAKRQKIKNLEGLAKELPAEPVTSMKNHVEIAPIYIDSDEYSSSNDEQSKEGSETDGVDFPQFYEALDESEPQDADQAFIKEFGNMLRRLDRTRTSIEEAMVFTLDNYERAETVFYKVQLIFLDLLFRSR